LADLLGHALVIGGENAGKLGLQIAVALRHAQVDFPADRLKPVNLKTASALLLAGQDPEPLGDQQVSLQRALRGLAVLGVFGGPQSVANLPAPELVRGHALIADLDRVALVVLLNALDATAVPPRRELPAGFIFVVGPLSLVVSSRRHQVALHR